MDAATLQRPSTTCPSAASRASRPATRTAEGPMSTPRRDCPRSRGTPSILIFLATLLSDTTGLLALSIFEVVVSAVIVFQDLRINAGQRARKWNGLSHVLQTTYPRNRALNTHTKPTVRNAAVFAQIQIPLERVFRQAVFANALQQMIVVTDALRAADDLAIPLRGQHVNAQRQIRTLRIGLHVKRFYLGRIAVDHHRLIELR